MYFERKRDKRTTLTPADVYDIRAKVAAGGNRREIAMFYGISKQAVEKIHWRDTFSHLPEDPAEYIGAAPVSAEVSAAAQASLERLAAKGLVAGIESGEGVQEPKLSLTEEEEAEMEKIRKKYY